MIFSKRLRWMLAGVVALLSIPLTAMQFSNEVHWTAFDFGIASVLLTCLALAIELILNNIKTINYRLIALIILLIVFALVWLELAVGIFGTAFAGS